MSDHTLVLINGVLAGYNFVWFLIVLRWRIIQGDPLGGIFYAIAYDLVLFGLTGSSIYRLYEGIPVSTTPFTWVITAGLLCGLLGQAQVLWPRKEKHGSDTQ